MKRLLAKYQVAARRRRGELFRRTFKLDRTTTILDLGGGNGQHIATILAPTDVERSNVTVADIDEAALNHAKVTYGFSVSLLDEASPLPFVDGGFDIVFCSSVIEHATLPKRSIWELRSGREFHRLARANQHALAEEIRRVSCQYFVQTPDPRCPLESHTLLPFANRLPRAALLPLIRWTNRHWVKSTQPDWCLVPRASLQNMFPEATIVEERVLGLPKSLMAISSSGGWQ